MNSKDVRNWLQNEERDFKTGVEIFETFAPQKSEAEITFFKKNMDAEKGGLHFNMLFQKISALLLKVESLENAEKNNGQKTIPAITIGNTPFTEKAKAERNLDRFNARTDNQVNLPENLQQKFSENQTLTAEISSLRADLEHAETDEKRKELADVICSKDDIRAQNWADIDAFYAGLEPIGDEVKATINKCKTYISRCFNSKTEDVQKEIKAKIAYLAEQKIIVTIADGKVTYATN